MTNTRLLTHQLQLRFFYRLLFWLPVAAFSGLLIYNTLPYFSLRQDFPFIAERAYLFEGPLYRISFYLHIAAGALCIAVALLLFSRVLLRKAPRVHRISGRVYVGVVLLLGAPTGLYMAFFAKGGIGERMLFLFMALWWFATTWNGLQAILRKNVAAHRIWMERSYAMALTAVTFRVYYLVFYLLGMDGLLNYELSLWISVLGNMLVAEALIAQRSRRYLGSFAVK
jgi:hypothetical protein